MTMAPDGNRWSTSSVRVPKRHRSVVPDQFLSARACRGSVTEKLTRTYETGSDSIPHAARCVTAAWHGYE
jgi:hypothetical protein